MSFNYGWSVFLCCLVTIDCIGIMDIIILLFIVYKTEQENSILNVLVQELRRRRLTSSCELD